MQSSITCPSCSQGIRLEPGGRIPPWCSKCGASLNSAAATADTSGMAASMPQPLAPKFGGPNYFHGCVPQVLQHERLTTYRFYVAGGELLAFPAGLGSILDSQFVPQTRVSRVIGGIGHGAHQISAGMRANDLEGLRQAEEVAQLEGASDEVLRESVLRIHGAVAIPPAELPHVRIEAPGMWFSLFRGIRCQAVLKLGHPHFGTLTLPSISDARRAVEGLRGLLGNAVSVNLPWGKKS
ncbi:MAG: hypothetical protein U0792_10490 [Gemmataceae bacterium]